jgi:hypothetical protein
MTTFTNTLALINTIRTTSCNNSPIETIAYFKNIMDKETFLAFENAAKEELAMDIVAKFWEHVKHFKKIPRIEEYIYSKALACCPFYDHDICYDEFFAEILHDAVGYLGYYLDDEQFEDFHGWYDEHYCHEGYLSAIEMMLKKQPIGSNFPTINEYCIKRNMPISIFFGKNAEILGTINVDDTEDRVFSIINTSLGYPMRTQVIKTKHPSCRCFLDYGFYHVDCGEIAKLAIGGTYTDDGVVVVRMN